jgi:hypothetical protein
MGVQEVQEVFVRAHAPLRSKQKWDRRCPKWPQFALVFDTEATLDPTQKLTFGCFRRYQLIDGKYSCIEEGLFYADNSSRADRRILQQYADDPRMVPSVENSLQFQLKVISRKRFISHTFWRAVRSGDLIVGFNLPFDLSRLAVKYRTAEKGGWSLVLAIRKSKKTGKIEIDPEKPRIVVESLNSKMAFYRLASVWNRDEWQNDSRFLDLRTLTWALRNRSYSLEKACRAFGVPGKLKHKLTGHVTPKEIKYCRGDVAASARLLNAAKAEFDQHPIKLDPDQAYSPASIAKAYLDSMNIAHPKEHFRVSNKMHGIAMQSYYGGRAECRIRKTQVPVVLTDFTSQYPTVNALLGNWNVLTASGIQFKPCTGEVKKLLSEISLEKAFNPSFWKNLSFFALVRPRGDILPVRTVYNGRTQNIGLNFLTSKKPIWYAGPDLIAATLLTPKPPDIVKAIRMIPLGKQKTLVATDLRGNVPIDPTKDDFFIRVIEQRSRLKREKDPGANFLKVLGNSGSYGLFVQIDPETRNKPASFTVYCGENRSRLKSLYTEKFGPWYFPPIASLITAGGRLLLAMLEKCVQNAKGSYLFCDTDSLCVIASKKGGLVPCIGGNRTLRGQEAIKSLSIDQVKSIAKRFNRLNPYDPSFVPSLLKIEDINFSESDSKKSNPRLWGYAIAAKRYALYTPTGDNISIMKASGHGLGYLMAPKEDDERDDEERDDDENDGSDDAPEWVAEAWDWLLRKEFGLKTSKPTWLQLPAMMRMAMTSPNVMKNDRPEWLAPFNFFFFPLLSDLGGYPRGFDRSNFRFITPPDSNRKHWKNLQGINLLNEKIYRISMYPDGKQNTVVPDTFQIILRQYLGHPEVKSLAPDGTACIGSTKGLLRRASIVAGEVVPIGKETDRRWEQGEDPSLVDFKLTEFRKTTKLVVGIGSDRERWKKIGVRRMMRRSQLSQKAVYAIIEGQPVRRQTLATFKRAVDGSLV